MIVSCSNCETKFEIPDDAYRPGRKARCSICGEVFVFSEWEEVSVQSSVLTEAQESVDSEASFDFPDSPDDIIPPKASQKIPAKSSRKKWAVALGAALVLALLAYGGVMVYTAFFASPKGGDPDRVSDPVAVASLGGRTSGADPEKEAARQAAVRRLALENVRQYTVTENESTGPMIVVEGVVVNNFDEPKDLILLEVMLFDKKGNPLVLREQYCGVVLSLLQLRTLARPAIESALVSQYMILINNTDIPSGGRVPFTTVFFDLPGSAYEFEVKIVDVQNSKKKD